MAKKKEHKQKEEEDSEKHHKNKKQLKELGNNKLRKKVKKEREQQDELSSPSDQKKKRKVKKEVEREEEEKEEKEEMVKTKKLKKGESLDEEGKLKKNLLTSSPSKRDLKSDSKMDSTEDLQWIATKKDPIPPKLKKTETKPKKTKPNELKTIPKHKHKHKTSTSSHSDSDKDSNSDHSTSDSNSFIIRDHKLSKKRPRESEWHPENIKKKSKVHETLATTRSRRNINSKAALIISSNSSSEDESGHSKPTKPTTDTKHLKHPTEGKLIKPSREESDHSTTPLKGRRKLVKWEPKQELFLGDSYKNCVEEDLQEVYSKPEAGQPQQSLSDIFKGIHFILTGLISNVLKKDFLSNQVQCAIKLMGGLIKPAIMNTPKAAKTKKQRPPWVLIAPTCLRTVKYMSALASRVPCIHYKWIIECYQQHCYLDPLHYLLPAGRSLRSKMKIIDPAIIEDYPPAISSLTFFHKKKNRQLRIEIVGNLEFRSNWGPVLYSAGAKIVERVHGDNQAKIDYILCDGPPTHLTKEKAKKQDIPLCTLEWLIQSLLSQKAKDPTTHPSLSIPL
eukprot:TRINITY_DN114_c0_g1_i5.p1 TRINITY_DN114_c0_g1~~TRINITY_DN114_c0_g1_i5.p1  ORF type:complete len:615 (+),score=234.04 TRINITY_DN114_c0_g1_i5:163-1845(+)